MWDTAWRDAETRFRDRTDAGVVLASALRHYAGQSDVVVLALPRGGVPVGYEIARALAAPLDVYLVRKLGVPGHEELALGAVSTGGVRVLNEDVVLTLGISDDAIEQVAARELEELDRRQRAYRGDRPARVLEGRVCILVDDGLATGATMRAAVAALRQERPSRIVVAVPVAAPPVADEFAHLVDELVCIMTPEPFYAVGVWYEDFSQTSDEEVTDLLKRARHDATQEGLRRAA